MVVAWRSEALNLHEPRRMNQAVYDRLVKAASARATVFYGELADLIGTPEGHPDFGATAGETLGEINRSEVAAGRPMLSAIVVSPDDHLPRRGFFNLGQELGVTLPDEDEVSFAVRQIRAVHDHWSDLEPFGGERPEA
jgi:hypothetical protein